MKSPQRHIRKLPALLGIICLYFAGIIFVSLSGGRNIETTNGITQVFADIYYSKDCTSNGVPVDCKLWHNNASEVTASAVEGAPPVPVGIGTTTITINRESH